MYIFRGRKTNRNDRDRVKRNEKKERKEKKGGGR